jgi:putative drug exporter of the RND superfamily
MSAEEADRPSTSGTPGVVARTARYATRHPRLIVAGWVFALVVAMGASHAAGTKFVNNLSLPGTESQRATSLLRTSFPAQAGDSDQIVLHVPRGRIDDPGVQARVSPVLARIRGLRHVTGVVSPFTAGARHAISADGTAAFAVVTFDRPADALPVSSINRVISVAAQARAPRLQVELGGRAIEQAHRPSLGAATGIGLLAAIIILLITFGSVLAMGLPIITALLGLGTALGLVGLGSHVLDTPDFATQLGALLGLGVGIDYALFIVTRFREHHAAGHTVRDAITAAMDTAGRAVLFAGSTVIIALLGMFVLGVSLLNAAAVASALSVALTLLATLTVLPVLLTRFGERIGSQTPAPRLGSRGDTVWPRWAAAVSRHPWMSLVAGLAIMLTLAVPALSLRLGQSDAGNDPTTLTTRRAYDLLGNGFGKGFNGPLQVVAHSRNAGAPATLHAVGTALAKAPDVAGVDRPTVSPDGRTAVFSVFAKSAPQSKETTDLVSRLRQWILPPVHTATGATLLVGGATATGIDFAHVLGGKLALFIAIVVLIAGLLLVLVFRSIAIPIQAAVMNLLSVAASLGVVVAIFQHGWLGSLLNVGAGPIEPFIPVLLFGIVFGLSMDYEVFLVSRIHEAWRRHRNPTAAMIDGIGSTGRLVTAAAAIMVCVFASFVLGDARIVKLFGLGLASAVFLDAFVVRSLLLPSVLTLLGHRTWMLPKLLERRLPRLAIEPRNPRPTPQPAEQS